VWVRALQSEGDKKGIPSLPADDTGAAPFARLFYIQPSQHSSLPEDNEICMGASASAC